MQRCLSAHNRIGWTKSGPQACERFAPCGHHFVAADVRRLHSSFTRTAYARPQKRPPDLTHLTFLTHLTLVAALPREVMRCRFLPLSRPQQLPAIFRRRLAKNLFEHAIEMRQRLEPDFKRNLTHPQVRVEQQVLSFLNTNS